ncbi:MAG: hypothetical protein ACI4XN_06590 [Candidatus Kurthia intestinigallinarum]
MKKKKFLNSLGLIMLIIFGGNFVVNYIRHDQFGTVELIGGIIGIVLLLIGGIVIKNDAPNKER